MGSSFTLLSLLQNIRLAKTNVDILTAFVEQHRWSCEWVKPVAGTIAFVKFSKEGQPVDDVALCKLLQERRGVMVCPGSRCFGNDKDFIGYVRMGFVCETEVLKQGLNGFEEFMRKDFSDVPLANVG